MKIEFSSKFSFNLAYKVLKSPVEIRRILGHNSRFPEEGQGQRFIRLRKN